MEGEAIRPRLGLRQLRGCGARGFFRTVRQFDRSVFDLARRRLNAIGRRRRQLLRPLCIAVGHLTAITERSIRLRLRTGAVAAATRRLLRRDLDKRQRRRRRHQPNQKHCDVEHSTFHRADESIRSRSHPQQARRPVILKTLLFLAFLAPPTELSETLRIRPLEPGLWLFQADHRWDDGPKIEANGFFVVGDERALMIDTGWTDEQAERLLDWAEAELPVPVRYVVATHWHWDRMGGMAAAQRRGVLGIALQRSAELGIENEIEPPLLRFRESMRLDLGGSAVELFFPGAGHTVDNITVWLDRYQMLYGGCMIKSARSNLGYIDEADLSSWLLAIDRLKRRYPQPQVVYPGHGKGGSVELLDHTHALVEGGLRPAD